MEIPLIFQTNLNAFKKHYPNIATLLSDLNDGQTQACSIDQQVAFVRETLEQQWNPEAELHLIYGFSSSLLAFELFKRIQAQDLNDYRNRRLMLIEDQPIQAVQAMRQKDWSGLIGSDRCLFVIDHASKQSLKRLVERYPDISIARFQLYAGSPNVTPATRDTIRDWLLAFQKITLAKRCSVSLGHTMALPKKFRLLTAGHNIFQDACVRGLERLGYQATRLQWRSPLYRFVCSSAWLAEYEQSRFDVAMYVNSTPAKFSPHVPVGSMPFKRVAWFLDNPRRYAFLPEHFEGCDVVGVFDAAYQQDVETLTSAKVIELKLGYALTEPSEPRPHDFENLDITFVGELGPKGFLPIERLFAEKEPRLPGLVKEFLHAHDVIEPSFMMPHADEFFAQHGFEYQGALVELVENQAAALRRRYYLEPLVELGLTTFGDDDWCHPQFAGPLVTSWAGKRLDYKLDLPHLYKNSKINMNIFHNQCIQALNPRVYDVLACGGFLLSSYNPGLEAEFDLGNDLVVFHTREELVEKVQYYLAHEPERNRIAKSGQAKVLAKFGYHDRLQTLLSYL